MKVHSKVMGLRTSIQELRSGKTPSRSFRPLKSLIFSGSSGHLVHLGFHLLLIGLGANGCKSNNNSIRSILDKEKLNGSNFLDWYHNLRIVLRNEQKLLHLEEALPEAPPITPRNLGKEVIKHEAKKELVETVKAFYAYKKEEGQSVSSYVLKMKAYLDQMERLVYPMPLVLGVNLILTSLSKDYDQFMQNYNMHDMGKTIPELHAMLKLVEKGIPKKALAFLAIRQGLRRIWKMNKGALDLYVGNGNRAAIEAIWSFDLIFPSGMDNGFLHKFMDNGAISVSKDNLFCFNIIPCDGIFEIDMHDHISNERSIYTCSNNKSKAQLGFYFSMALSSCPYKQETHCKAMARKPFSHASERADDLLGLIHSDVCGSFRTTSREGANYYITFTDDFIRYGYVYLMKHKHEVFEMFKTFQNEVENQLRKTIKALLSDRGGEYLSQEFLDHLRSHGVISQLTLPYTPQHNVYRRGDMEPCLTWQDAQPSDNTSEHQPEAEHDDVDPQTDVNLIRRSARIPRAPEQYGFYVNVEEHELGYHGEPPNYQAALSNPKSKKWLEAMNTEMQSMKDNQVWILVDLPPDCKTVGSKWIFKKKTDMDGNIHTYKARLLAKGFTQTYGVDYEETFSLVADIKAIRILIAIAAYYDYEIWQMDVKTAFLNGLLNKDVYMVQPEGFVNHTYPRRVCKL
ncbi:retrotransposon protein, putative, ty1-copia subclass [Tanacetum coccineum]